MEGWMTATALDYDIVDIGLAEQGRMRSDWAERQMPVLQTIRERFAKEQPLQGYRIAVSLHITPETAPLLRTRNAGGAELPLCRSHPRPTAHDVSATPGPP